MIQRYFILFILIFFTTACAVGPLVSNETARSVGDSNHELSAGYGVAGWALKWNYGMFKNLDFGLQLESLSFGLRFKYSVLNNQNGGLSLAFAAGMGSSLGGEHSYGDMIMSYLGEKWEPYTTLRYVHVETDPLDFKDEKTGEIDFQVKSFSYDYGQAMIGARYWFDKSMFMSMEASSIFSLSNDVVVHSNLIAGLALGWRLE